MKALDYDRDFAAWAQRNADLLRSGKLAEADIGNIAEEIESLGKSQHSALKSHARQIVAHLLKMRLAGETDFIWNRAHWGTEIDNHRAEIEQLLELSPSLRNELTPEALGRIYSRELRSMERHIRMRLPEQCPLTWDDVLGEQD